MTWTTWSTNSTFGSGTSIYLAPQPQVNHDMPMLIGHGDPEFTTSTDLVPLRAVVCYDVNHYYRDLGVHWKASKRELFLAYRDGDGADNARKTFVFKQLINPEVRRKYDLAPLGSKFIDTYVMAEITREIKRQMAKARMDTGDTDEFARVAKAFGFNVEPPKHDDPLADGFDKEAVQDQDVSDPPETLAPEVPFRYPFYLWRSTCYDRERLALWQALLVTAFAIRGVRSRLAVGFHGRMAHPWMHATVGRRLVVFLNEEHEPTAEMAEAVAELISKS